MPLTTFQLVRLIATETGLSQKKSSEILKVLMDTFIETLANGDSVRIRGFGKFYLNYQNQRIFRHPSTHKSIRVGPKKIVKFKCFKSLRHEINYLDFEDFDITRFKRENEKILQQLYEIVENSGDFEWGENEEDMF